MTRLAAFREQNPAYKTVPDEQLADALHRKFYSSVPKAEFLQRLGVGAQPEAAEPPGLRQRLQDQTNQNLETSGVTQAPEGSGVGTWERLQGAVKGGFAALTDTRLRFQDLSNDASSNGGFEEITPRQATHNAAETARREDEIQRQRAASTTGLNEGRGPITVGERERQLAMETRPPIPTRDAIHPFIPPDARELEAVRPASQADDRSFAEQRSQQPRGVHGTISDTVSQLGQAVVQIASTPVSLFAPDSPLAQRMQARVRDIEATLTPTTRSRLQVGQQRIQEAAQSGRWEEAKAVYDEYLTDPVLAQHFIMTTVPSFLGVLGPAKVAQMLVRMRGGSAAAASSAAALTAGGANATLTGGDARQHAYDDLLQTYQKAGMPEAEAHKQALRESQLVAAVGMGLGWFGGRYGAESAVLGMRGWQSKGAAALKAFGRELGTEFAEELIPLVLTNSIASGTDQRDPLQDVLGTAGQTLLATGPMASAGAVGAARAPSEMDLIQREIDEAQWDQGQIDQAARDALSPDNAQWHEVQQQQETAPAIPPEVLAQIEAQRQAAEATGDPLEIAVTELENRALIAQAMPPVATEQVPTLPPTETAPALPPTDHVPTLPPAETAPAAASSFIDEAGALDQDALLADAFTSTEQPTVSASGAPFPSARIAQISARQRGLDAVAVPVGEGWGLMPIQAAPQVEVEPGPIDAAHIANEAALQQEGARAEHDQVTEALIAMAEWAEPLLTARGTPFRTERVAAISARQRGLDAIPVEVPGGWGLIPSTPPPRGALPEPTAPEPTAAPAAAQPVVQRATLTDALSQIAQAFDQKQDTPSTAQRHRKRVADALVQSGIAPADAGRIVDAAMTAWSHERGGALSGFLPAHHVVEAADALGFVISTTTTAATPTAEASHTDGHAIEPVTAAVIGEAVADSTLAATNARAWLLGEVARAKARTAEPALVAEYAELITRTKAAHREAALKKTAPKRARELREWANNAEADTLPRLRERIGYRSFDVPGDGTFRILNTPQNLEAFAEKVRKTSAFRKHPVTTQPTEGRATPREAADTDQAAEREPRGDQADTTGAEPRRIEDFGEKIAGARKDVWQAYADAIREAGEIDIAAEPLSKSWPAPDYGRLLEAGVEPRVVAHVRALRDEVPTKPQAAWRLRAWAEKVRTLRDTAGQLMDGTLPADQLTQHPDITGRAELYLAVGHAQSLKGVRLSRNAYSIHNGQQYDPPRVLWTVSKAAKATAFSNWPRELATGATREEAIAAFTKRIRSTDIDPPAAKTLAFDIYSYRNRSGVWIGKKIGRHTVDLKRFDSAAEARAYKADHQAELERLWAEYKDVPAERRETNEPRVGEDHRTGADVSPEQFAETFGFRGVQFGNYVEGARRQADLNDAYDALMDLAAVLDVSPRALSLEGALGLAFGARGKGGKGAASAHYEPGQIVINLTKTRGAGSLAHEWFHALDNYFARARGERGGHITADPFKRAEGVRPEMVQAFRGIMEAIERSSLAERSANLDKRRSKAYWGTPEEMSARAFESYVIAKLQDQGAANDYLANIVSEESFRIEAGYPYITAGELPAIRAAFDHFFDTVQVRETDKGLALHESIDPYADGRITTRPGTRDAQRDAGRDALRDLHRRLFGMRAQGRDGVGGSEITVLGSRIYEGFVAGDANQLSGQTIDSPADLAALAQVYRDPRFETLRIIYTRGKRIVGETGFSSRLPAIVALPDPGEFNAHILQDSARFEADGFWLLHNHPSGSAEPSVADVRLTNRIAQAHPGGFRGHIVIDHNEFSTIQGGGRVDRVKAPWLNGVDFKSRPELEHRLLGTEIGGPKDVAALGRALQIPAGHATVVMTSKSSVQIIIDLPAALLGDATPRGLARIKAAVRRTARGSGSGSHRFVVLPEGVQLDAMQYLLAHGIFTDVVSADGRSLLLSGVRHPGDFLDTTARAMRTNEEASPYRTPPPSETRFRATQRVWQDKFNRFSVIQDWLKDQGVQLSEGANAYRAEERMHGRAATRMEDFREKRVKPIVQRIRKAGFNLSEIADFLHAQHAQERNEQIAKINSDRPDGGSGMTTAEARTKLAEYRKRPELVALADELRAITDDTRAILLRAGLITEEMSAAWTATYRHYVPLKGGPDTDASQQGTGRGLTVKERQKRALGHESRDEGEWIIENLLQAHERAILQAEKNRVGQHLLKLAMEAANPDLITIGQPVKRQVLTDREAFVVEYRGAQVEVFHSFADARRWVGQESLKAGRKPGDFEIRTSHDLDVVLMPTPTLDPSETQVYVKGHAIRVQFKDELLARAWNNMGAEHMNQIFRLARGINTWLSKVYTAYNPEFLGVNVVRDFTTGLINMTGEEGATFAAKSVANYGRSFAELLRFAWTGNASNAIKDYRADGGTTGAAYLSDLERIGLDIDAAYGKYAGVVEGYRSGGSRKAARVAGQIMIDVFLGWIEKLNMAGENAMRLAVYRTAIESGMTRARAAALAKNSTVNFNRRGENGQMMGALYLFWNPAVQGGALVAHALFKGKHKRQAQAVIGGLVALGYWVAASMGGGPPDEWEKVSDFAKERYLHIWKGDGWVKIPIAYGYGFFVSLGRQMHAIEQGDDRAKAALRIAESLVEEFSIWGGAADPDGDERNILFLAPTLVQIPGAVLVNRTGLGSPVYPESKFDESRPDHLKMWRGTQGSAWATTAKQLNAITGGNVVEKGWLDVSPETLKYLWRTATGGAGRFFTDSAALGWNLGVEKLPLSDIETREIPLVRKFVHEANDIRGARSRFWDGAGEVREAIEAFRRAKSLENVTERRDESSRIRMEQRELLALGRVTDGYIKLVATKRDRVQALMSDDTKPLAYRRAAVRRLEREEGEIYDKYVALFRRSKENRARRLED